MTLRKYFFGVFSFFVVVYVTADDDECNCIDFEMEEMKKCKDWDSAIIHFDVKIDIVDGHGIFNGEIEVLQKVQEGEVTMVVMLMTPKGEELVYTTGIDLCEALGDTKAMWAPVMETFSTTKCPIPEGKYNLSNVKVNSDALRCFMSDEFVGTYAVTISAELSVVKYVCFKIVLDLYKEKRLKSECEYPQND